MADGSGSGLHIWETRSPFSINNRLDVDLNLFPAGECRRRRTAVSFPVADQKKYSDVQCDEFHRCGE